MLLKEKNKKIFLFLIIVCISVFFIVSILNMPYKDESKQLIMLNTTDWSNIINENEETFVYVGKESCEQCLKFKPLLENVVKNHRLEFYYFDTDINEDIKDEIIKRYNIIAVPSIVVLKDDDFYIIMDSDNNMIIEEILKII